MRRPTCFAASLGLFAACASLSRVSLFSCSAMSTLGGINGKNRAAGVNDAIRILAVVFTNGRTCRLPEA